MKFVYTGKGMEVSESLKARVEKKLGKMERYFNQEAEATVRLKQQKGARNIIEITVSVGSLILRAEECSNDMYLSIDRAVDKLESQLRRHRNKLEKRAVTLGEYNMMNDTYEILEGLTEEDYLAFPDYELCYEGAPTTRTEATQDAPAQDMMVESVVLG